METNELTTEEYIEIAEKVRSGEYFREVRQMVDIDLHQPMTDRYWYILLTIPALLIVIFAVSALQSLYPLKPRVAFIYGINDIVEDVPRIKTLVQYDGEPADVALQRFLVSNYVKEREEYNVLTFDRNQTALQTLSTPDVFSEYEKSVAVDNPSSPIVLYQRHTARNIKILSTTITKKPEEDDLTGRDYAMRLVYDESLTPERKNVTLSRWQVDVAFKYEAIKIDEKTSKIEPYRFLVTGYKTRRL